jgi:sugar diacid utilization regulator
MEMNINTIFSKLKYKNKEIFVNSAEPLPINNIKLYKDNQHNFMTNVLYVADEKNFLQLCSKNNCDNILCTVKSGNNSFNQDAYAGKNVLFLYDEVLDDVLIEELEEILNHFLEFLKNAQELFLLLVDNKGIQKILDKGYELLGNLIVFSDTSMCVVFCSDNVLIDEELKNWLYDDSLNRYNKFYLKHKKERGFEKSYKSKIPVYVSKEVDDYAHLASKVFIEERLVGYLTVIESERKIEEDDYDIISVLCNVISLELQKNREVRNERGFYYERLFVELLEERIKDPLIIDDKIKHLDLQLKENLYVFVFQVSQEELANTNFAYIRNIIEDLITGFKTVIYNDQIIGIISISENKDLFEDFDLMRLKLFLKNNKMNCGISFCFYKIKHLSSAYKQSLKAIEMGTHLNSEERIFNYEDFANYHMMSICSIVDDVKSFCHPFVLKLLEYDRTFHSELVPSLYMYLLCEKNQRNTANVLHVHRSTLLYRIKRAEEIMNLNLKNGNTVFNLLCSFKILEFLGEIDYKDYLDIE